MSFSWKEFERHFEAKFFGPIMSQLSVKSVSNKGNTNRFSGTPNIHEISFPDSLIYQKNTYKALDFNVFYLTRSIRDSETSIDFVQGIPGSRRERVNMKLGFSTWDKGQCSQLFRIRQLTEKDHAD